jgi:hypothetical protein
VHPPIHQSARTVYSLSIPLHLAVKDCVFVLGQHLCLGRHLHLPAIDLLQAFALSCERVIERLDYGVDVAEALALAVLLVAGQAPWDFPGGMLTSRRHIVGRGASKAGMWQAMRNWAPGGMYHSRPPESGFVRRKAPNIVIVWVRDAGQCRRHDAMF